ncbi:MAG: hypothetical protein QM642_12240 [Edaphocola sp.]
MPPKEKAIDFISMAFLSVRAKDFPFFAKKGDDFANKGAKRRRIFAV